MKKIHLLWSLCLALFTLAGCDKDGEYVDRTYIEATVSFIGPSDGYEIRYNGKKVTTATIYGKNNSTGKLEVYKTGKDTPELLEEITLTKDMKIELLKLLGRGVVLAASVSEDEYTTFTPNITFSNPNGSDQYTVTFNDEELSLRSENYIAKDALEGTLKIIRNSDGSILYEEKMTIVPKSTINITELAEESFVNLSSSGGEPDPESRQYTKIRFIYTADAFPGHDKLKLAVYLLGLDKMNLTSEPIETIDLSADEMSEFIQIDNNTFGEDGVHVVFDLIAEDGTKIVDSAIHYAPLGEIGNSDNRFVTFRLTDSSEDHQGGDWVKCTGISYIQW